MPLTCEVPGVLKHHDGRGDRLVLSLIRVLAHTPVSGFDEEVDAPTIPLTSGLDLFDVLTDSRL